MGSPLVAIAASKRSRIVAVLAFAGLVVLFVSNLREPGALFFGRPTRPAAVVPEPPRPPEYHGPRFELFGMPDFAAEVEIATLHIRAKEEPVPMAPPSKGSPGLAHGHHGPPTGGNNNNNNDDLNGNNNNLNDINNKNKNTGLGGGGGGGGGGGDDIKPALPVAPRGEEAGVLPRLPPHQRQLPIGLPKLTAHRLDAPDFDPAELDRPVPGTPQASITLDVPARNPPPADASRMVFGVATTLDRMAENLRNFGHWAAGTGARFVVVHEPRDPARRPGEPDPAEVARMCREAGLAHVTLVERDAGWGERFVGLLADVHDRAEPQAEWAVLIDDDTFFFDLRAVQAMLARYDAARPWYVGALSDNKWNVNHGGLYAVGGAGVFLSRPLLEALRPVAESCRPGPGETTGGDTLVGECVHRHTTTKLSVEHGLHQLDIHGDATGFYEAPRPQPLSVHHWKSWHHHDIPAVAAVARACGPACVLQNFRFQDGWQMSNGFSIFKHGYTLEQLAAQHAEAMEHTWKPTAWDIEDSWKYSLAPLKDRDDRKVQFLMEKSVVEEDGSVTLYYVRRENGVGRGLIRVIWR